MTTQEETCTIYLLKNKVNNKIYIGQTWLPLHKRMGLQGKNYKNSIYLFSAIQKYGSENFEYEVLATCKDQAAADEFEAYFIIKYNSTNHEIGYNLKEGGSAGRHSEETKAKMSKTMSEKIWSEEALAGKAKGGESWIGKSRPPRSEEWKEENSIRTKERHANNPHPMLGKEHSEATKAKISEAMTGKKKDPESVKRGASARQMSPERELAIIKAYKSGKNIRDIETEFDTGRSSVYRILKRNNIPKSNNFTKWTDRKHSEDTKSKMSDARKKYWDNKKTA